MVVSWLDNRLPGRLPGGHRHAAGAARHLRRAQRKTPLFAKLAIVVVLVAHTAGASSESANEASSIQQLIALGIQHNTDSDYDAADEIWKQLEKLSPEHPAANVYGVETLYWRMVHEDDGTRFDDAVEAECNEAIRKAEAWVEARPAEALGHFYLGQALMQLGRLHGIRTRVFKAWLLGERARRALEHTLELDPDLIDAKFPIGLYYYYASLVPDVFNWLGFLWFVPTGNGDLGISLMEDVAGSGDLYRMTAQFHLADIRAERAGRIDLDWAESATRRMHARYPQNALVHFQLIELLESREKYEELVREARALEAHPGKSRQNRGHVATARVWRARGEMMLHRIDEAWKTLLVFGEDGPGSPDWGPRWVKLTRAQLLDLRGEREKALTFYRSLSAMGLDSNFTRLPAIAQAGIERPFVLTGPTPATSVETKSIP